MILLQCSLKFSSNHWTLYSLSYWWSSYLMALQFAKGPTLPYSPPSKSSCLPSITFLLTGVQFGHCIFLYHTNLSMAFPSSHYFLICADTIQSGINRLPYGEIRAFIWKLQSVSAYENYRMWNLKPTSTHRCFLQWLIKRVVIWEQGELKFKLYIYLLSLLKCL